MAKAETRLARFVATAIALLVVGGCQEKKDEETLQREKRFASEAVLVRTCPGDPSLISGETAVVQKVYRWEGELWAWDRRTLRRVEGTPETVCRALVLNAP